MEGRVTNRYLTVFHCISWGYPTIFITLLLTLAPHAIIRGETLGWCFIGEEYGWWRIFAIYGPLFFCWVLTVIFCLAAQRRIKALAKMGLARGNRNRSLREVTRKLSWIPFVFIFARIWDALYRIVEIRFTHAQVKSNWSWLPYLVAIGVTSQGTANALIFVVSVKKVRQRYCDLLCGKLFTSPERDFLLDSRNGDSAISISKHDKANSVLDQSKSTPTAEESSGRGQPPDVWLNGPGGHAPQTENGSDPRARTPSEHSSEATPERRSSGVLPGSIAAIKCKLAQSSEAENVAPSDVPLGSEDGDPKADEATLDN